MDKAINKCSAFLYSFPFWLFVDLRDPPDLEMLTIGNAEIRVYPPFRSAPANSLSMPAIRVSSIPFLKGRRPKDIHENDESTLLCLATMPQLAISGIQDAGNTLVWGKTWDKDKCPIAFPMDSLRLDVLRSTVEGESSVNHETFVKRLILNLRSISGQWWLASSTDPLLGWFRNEFPIDRFGKPEGELYAAGRARSPRGTELPVNKSIWHKALKLTEKGADPDIVDQMLLDAAYFASSANYRRFVLEAATACEIAKDKSIERVWVRNNEEPYKRGKVLSGYDLGKHIDVQLRKICGRSFRDELPEIYQSIQLLWDARGNVAHGDSAFYRVEGITFNVDEEKAFKLLIAAEKCVQWLNNL